MLGALLGGLSSVIKAGTGVAQMIQAGKIHPNYVPYEESKYAGQKLGLAQNLFNGRSAGAAANERNIYSSQASTLNNFQRNSADASQLLSLAGGAQAQSNDAFANLGIQEDKNKYSLLDNLNQGYQGMINEGDKVYQDKMKKFEIDTQQKAALRGAGVQNMVGAVGDAAGMFGQMEQQKQNNAFYSQALGGMAGGLGGGGNGVMSFNPNLLQALPSNDFRIPR